MHAEPGLLILVKANKQSARTHYRHILIETQDGTIKLQLDIINSLLSSTVVLWTEQPPHLSLYPSKL